MGIGYIMRDNAAIAVSTPDALLVPYEQHHVVEYHEWMQNEELLELTASESLSIEKEYEMQQSWRRDDEKLTFISCLPLDKNLDPTTSATKIIMAGVEDAPERMLGDVNMYLKKDKENDTYLTGEIEIMIAREGKRGLGHGRASLKAFLAYIAKNEKLIVAQYKNRGKTVDRIRDLTAQILMKNTASVQLFESVGFNKVSTETNFFGEVELRIVSNNGNMEDGSSSWAEQFFVEGYRELPYQA